MILWSFRFGKSMLKQNPRETNHSEQAVQIVLNHLPCLFTAQPKYCTAVALSKIITRSFCSPSAHPTTSNPYWDRRESERTSIQITNPYLTSAVTEVKPFWPPAPKLKGKPAQPSFGPSVPARTASPEQKPSAPTQLTYRPQQAHAEAAQKKASQGFCWVLFR